jgi:3-dehydroquinate synthase
MTRNRFQKFPPYTQEFHIDHSYPVCFTSDLFTGDNQTIRRTLTTMGHDQPVRCAVFVDSGVVARNRNLIKQITLHFAKEHALMDLCHAPFVMAGGESVKNSRRMMDEILSIAHTHHLTRDSLAFVVGGGAFLDGAGSALAQCRGGIPTANIPTSTLAQCAAGIGTMRFMNACGIKNFSGIAAPPYAVFIDFSLLKTMPFEHHLSGMAEAFKMALATDAEFFSILARKARKIRQNDPATVEKVVHKTALLHLEQIRNSSHPFSENTIGPSGLGCRVAHWLETRSGDKLTHGHAPQNHAL